MGFSLRDLQIYFFFFFHKAQLSCKTEFQNCAFGLDPCVVIIKGYVASLDCSASSNRRLFRETRICLCQR